MKFKIFLSKLSIIVLIFLAFLFLANYAVFNYTSLSYRFQKFEDSYLKQKHNFLLSKFEIDKNDRLFFGTSKFYRHIDPILFDSLMNDGKRSYNLGHAALFPFRLFDYINLWNNNFTDNFKGEIIIELTVPQNMNEGNYKTTEIVNSVNFEGLYSLIVDEKYLGASSIYSSIYLNRFGLLAFLKKYTLSGAFGISDNNNSVKFNKDFILNHRGFYPLDIDKNEGAINQRTEYLKGDSIIKTDIVTEMLPDFNSGYADYILDWIKQNEMDPDKISFIITPRQNPRTLRYLISVGEILSRNGYSVISMANSEIFPELYEQKYSFDRGHLNLAGVKFFNIYLSDLYKLNKSSHELP